MEKNVFEQMAKKYDSEERIELAKIVSTEIRKKLQDAKAMEVIDYGGGTGLVSLAIADLVSSVLLIDASEQMTAVAQSKIIQEEIENVSVLHADFTKEKPDVKADIVIMSLVLLHIPNTKEVLQQLYTILRDGGRLLIVDFDKQEEISHPLVHNGFSHDVLKELFMEVGFKSSTMNTFHYGKNVFMNKDASMFIAESIK